MIFRDPISAAPVDDRDLERVVRFVLRYPLSTPRVERVLRRALRRLMGRHDRWSHPVLARRRMPNAHSVDARNVLSAVLTMDRL